MLGYDSEYSDKLDDDALMTYAKKEKRILLTRDLELCRRALAKGMQAFYHEGETREEKLAELAQQFNVDLRINMQNSRCPICNTRIKPIPKEAIVDKVRPNTLKHYNEFWQCPHCGQVYWQGAHWERIQKMLEKAQYLRKVLGHNKNS